MGSFHSFLALVAVSLSLAPSVAAQTISQCPTTASTYTGRDGGRYAICPSTDYEGANSQQIENSASVTACAQLCGATPTCLKAVYDSVQKRCYVKSNAKNALTWVQNTRYSTVYINNTLPEAANIARCPAEETRATVAGKAYRTCANTDIRGRSAQMVNDVANTAACAQICSNVRDGCANAVYDKQARVCHIKADAATDTLIWSTNKRYDVIRKDVALNPAAVGSWSDLVRLPVIPVAAYVVPSFPEVSRLMFWSSWGVDAFGGAGGRTQFADWNYQTGSVSARTVANTKHDMFCPAISSLEDGRIIISGGGDAEVTTYFNPDTNTFDRGPDMKVARGYQTSTTTSEGKVFTIGGAYSGPRASKDGEIFDPATSTWTTLPAAVVKPMLTTDHEGVWRTDNHAWLVSWKNASVFQAGPSKAQNWYGTKGTGSWKAAGTRDTQDAMCGIYVMYEPGKILSAAGSQDYTNSPATNKAHITTITEPNVPATVEQVASLVYPRGFANAVVLPDGQVLVTGGQKRSLVFTDTDGALFPELFNPVTKKWSTMAAEAVPRNYHSTSLLLPDATVWSGGGGLCYVNRVGGSSANCDKSVDHADGQIFSPPYLFDPATGKPATRPSIDHLWYPSVKVGGKLEFTVNTANAKVVLVRLGSVTHSINSDQRRVPLTKVVVTNRPNNKIRKNYTATLPADSGILLPGFYYLFAINSAGVPSIAKTVQITL